MIENEPTVLFFFFLQAGTKTSTARDDVGITNPKGGGRFFFLIKKVQDLRFLVEQTQRTKKTYTDFCLVNCHDGCGTLAMTSLPKHAR